jgi:uncharacterized protein (TIRG00374 family)
MAKKLLPFFKYVLFTALAVFFVWLSTKDLDAEKWKQLKDALGRANYLLFFPILFLLMLSHWIRGLRWKMLIDPMGYNTSRVNIFLGIMIGYFVNLGAPRLGEVVKCTILAKYEKVPADKLVGTIVAERAIDLLSLAIIFGISFIVEFKTISEMTVSKVLPMFENKDGSASYNKILFLVAGAAIFLLALKFLFSKLGHINIVQKVRGIIAGVWQGVVSIKDVKNKGMFVVHSISIWALYLLSTWLGFFALPETSHLSLSEAMPVLAMGSVGMIVAPGGIGAYAYFVQQTVGFYNIPSTPFGLALGWLLWFGQFVTFIICGVVSFIVLPIINKKKENEEFRDHPTKAIQTS